MIETADEFIQLRYSDDSAEYERAAGDSAPIVVWRDVIAQYPEARMWVAQNKTVPLEILQELAGDSDPSVRAMVAMKRKLSPELLDQLASDPDDSVRLSVARHKKTSRQTLERLRVDAWGEVREVASDRLESSP